MKLTFQIIAILLLLSGCSSATVQSITTPTVISTSTPQNTKTPQPTETSTLLATATTVSKKVIAITATFEAELAVEATIAAFGTICQESLTPYHAEISPDGRWIAMMCRGQYGVADSYLRVLSLQNDTNWVINHADYTKIVDYDTDGMIHPFQWSSDGKYLYATSPSRISGCCWIGDDLLLVRLNLDNGTQTEIFNYISDGSGIPGVNFSISPTENYIISIPQDGSSNLYVLDRNTWKKRTIKLKFENTGAGYTLMSNNEKKIILVLREYPAEYQGDLTYGSLAVIDLISGSQNKILSGLDYDDTPTPVRWQDDDHVLLQRNGETLQININTGEITKADEP